MNELNVSTSSLKTFSLPWPVNLHVTKTYAAWIHALGIFQLFSGEMGSSSDREYAWWIFTTSVIGWEVCQWGGLEYSQPLWLVERRVNGAVYDYSIITADQLMCCW